MAVSPPSMGSKLLKRFVKLATLEDMNPRNLLFFVYIIAAVAWKLKVSGLSFGQISAERGTVGHIVGEARTFDDADEDANGEVDADADGKPKPKDKDLHAYECSVCEFIMFPALGREGRFFPDSFKCPGCGADKSKFSDVRDNVLEDVALGDDEDEYEYYDEDDEKWEDDDEYEYEVDEDGVEGDGKGEDAPSTVDQTPTDDPKR
jgi:rubredoxin